MPNVHEKSFVRYERFVKPVVFFVFGHEVVANMADGIALPTLLPWNAGQLR